MSWWKRALLSPKARRQFREPVWQALAARCDAIDSAQLLRAPIDATRFVVMDTETTGFSAYGGDQVVSISLIEYQGLYATGRCYNRLVNPRRKIPPAATAIHHISDTDVSDAPVLTEILPEIVEFMDDAVLVGHHLAFDLRFLNRALRKAAGCGLRHPLIDTMLLYLGYSGQVGHYSLDEVARACGVTIHDRHSARGDAEAAAAIFAALAQQMVGDLSLPVVALIQKQGGPDIL